MHIHYILFLNRANFMTHLPLTQVPNSLIKSITTITNPAAAQRLLMCTRFLPSITSGVLAIFLLKNNTHPTRAPTIELTLPRHKPPREKHLQKHVKSVRERQNRPQPVNRSVWNSNPNKRTRAQSTRWLIAGLAWWWWFHKSRTRPPAAARAILVEANEKKT